MARLNTGIRSLDARGGSLFLLVERDVAIKELSGDASTSGVVALTKINYRVN